MAVQEVKLYEQEKVSRLADLVVNQLNSFSESIGLLSGAVDLSFSAHGADEFARILKKALDSSVIISVDLLRNLLLKSANTCKFTEQIAAEGCPLNADRNNLNFLLQVAIGFYHNQREYKLSPEVIITTHITNAVSQLSALGIVGETTLDALTFQISELNSVLAYCKQIQLQWDEIKSTLPDELQACFKLSANGLRKLSAFKCLAAQLPYDSWAYRDNCFTSYNMDFRLAELQQKQAFLLPLEKKLAQFLDTNLLSDSASLVQLQNIIEHAGMLRWFSGRWRKAKQKTLSLAVNKQLKLNDIVLLFPAMITYSNVNQEFNALFRQEPILSELNQGTKSKLKTIESVREWYKDVLFQIDEEFCGDTAIAQGLFNLNVQLACELQQIYSDELVVHIAQLNRKMTKLQLVFPGYAWLYNADTEFTGVIKELKSILAEQVTVLNEYCLDQGQSLNSCSKCG